MDIDRTYVWSHCETWIHAWNRRDLNKILSHYTDELIFISPKISLFLPENKEKIIRTKKDLSIYFANAFQKLPTMQLEMVDVIFDPVGRTAVLDYWNHLTPTHSVRVMERMRYSREGKIDNVMVCYGIEQEGQTE